MAVAPRGDGRWPWHVERAGHGVPGGRRVVSHGTAATRRAADQAVLLRLRRLARTGAPNPRIDWAVKPRRTKPIRTMATASELSIWPRKRHKWLAVEAETALGSVSSPRARHVVVRDMKNNPRGYVKIAEVPAGYSAELADELRSLGIKVQLHTTPSGGHAIHVPAAKAKKACQRFAYLLGAARGLPLQNPRRVRATRGRYVRERVADPRAFDPRSLRTVVRRGHRVVVGCPRGQWSARRRRCKVGTRAQAVLHPMRNPRFATRPENAEVQVWEERDRLHIEIRNRRTGKTIMEWWDDDARQMFEDGFFDSRRLKRSVIEYAQYVGLLAKGNPRSRNPATYWVVYVPGKGAVASYPYTSAGKRKAEAYARRVRGSVRAVTVPDNPHRHKYTIGRGPTEVRLTAAQARRMMRANPTFSDPGGMGEKHRRFTSRGAAFIRSTGERAGVPVAIEGWDYGVPLGTFVGTHSIAYDVSGPPYPKRGYYPGHDQWGGPKDPTVTPRRNPRARCNPAACNNPYHGHGVGNHHKEVRNPLLQTVMFANPPRLQMGDRVRIKPGGGMPEFYGKTGQIIGSESYTKGRVGYFRVRLDEPVNIPGVGVVTDDLWMPHLLQKLRGGLENPRRRRRAQVTRTTVQTVRRVTVSRNAGRPGIHPMFDPVIVNILNSQYGYPLEAAGNVVREWRAGRSKNLMRKVVADIRAAAKRAAYTKGGRNPLTRGEAADVLRSSRHDLRAARAGILGEGYAAIKITKKERRFYAGRGTGKAIVAKLHGPAGAMRPAEKLMAKGYYAGMRANPPHRIKVPWRVGQRIPVAKARAWVVSTGDRDLLRQFDAAYRLQTKANRRPQHVVWRTVGVGSAKRIDMVTAAAHYGDSPETYYTAPRGSKKGTALYRHKWGEGGGKRSVPLLAAAGGKALIVPLAGRKVAGDWMRH